jgi:hypothetical protein
MREKGKEEWREKRGEERRGEDRRGVEWREKGGDERREERRGVESSGERGEREEWREKGGEEKRGVCLTPVQYTLPLSVAVNCGVYDRTAIAYSNRAVEYICSDSNTNRTKRVI